MQLIEGKKIASQIKSELKEKIDLLIAEGKQVPGLVTILVGDDPASAIYVGNKGKGCLEIGMHSKTEILPASTSEEELLNLVNKYNKDDAFHGILVQLPLPKHIDENKIIESISPEKDVDGFHPFNIGNLMIGRDTLVSCTPAGIHEMLKRYEIETVGKHVVVLGRSNIVGKPIANIMMQKKPFANSIVTVCHSAAKNLSDYTKTADILIAAIGVPKFVTGDMVKDGVVIIDVGINRIKDDTHPKGTRVVGDVDFDSVSPKASYFTPVPGGVGLMTIAMLLKNTYQAYTQIKNKL